MLWKLEKPACGMMEVDIIKKGRALTDKEEDVHLEKERKSMEITNYQSSEIQRKNMQRHIAREREGQRGEREKEIEKERER